MRDNREFEVWGIFWIEDILRILGVRCTIVCPWLPLVTPVPIHLMDDTREINVERHIIRCSTCFGQSTVQSIKGPSVLVTTTCL